jgi:hypothetical protein
MAETRKSMYTDAPEAVAIVAAAFPSYQHRNGRLEVKPFQPVTPTSYWSGGTREYWAFVRLADMKASPAIPENGSGFTPDVGRIESLPEGFALVCLIDGNIRLAEIRVNPDSLNRLIPTGGAVQLSQDQQLVLVLTKSFKPSYRREEASRLWRARGDTLTNRWNEAVSELTRHGLLNRAGAITTAGRNAVEALRS